MCGISFLGLVAPRSFVTIGAEVAQNSMKDSKNFRGGLGSSSILLCASIAASKYGQPNVRNVPDGRVP